MKKLLQVRIFFADSGDLYSVAFFDNFDDLYDYLVPELLDDNFIFEISRKEVRIL